MSSSKFSYHPKNIKKYTKNSKHPHNKYENTGPEYFSCEKEKKKFCSSFKKNRRNEISFTCPFPETMGDVKSSSVLEDMMSKT